jgi:sialic acid synthase SpsE
MLALKRPGTGLSAADLKHVVGRVAARSISSGTTLEITHLR